MLDALMALQHSVDILHLKNSSSQNGWHRAQQWNSLNPFGAADVDRNGQVDAAAALLILQKSVGLIEQFPAAG